MALQSRRDARTRHEQVIKMTTQLQRQVKTVALGTAISHVRTLMLSQRLRYQLRFPQHGQAVIALRMNLLCAVVLFG